MKREPWNLERETSLPWLLEPDPANPGVRYFVLTELLDRPADDPEVVAAQRAVMTGGPVPAILEAQYPAGYWVKAGSGYAPKYRGTVWSVIFLAQLGADGNDPRMRAGGAYVLDHARSPYGGFTALMETSPAGMVHCLQGNLCAALLDLGWLGDKRLAEALDWLARSITGEGIAPAQACAEPCTERSRSGRRSESNAPVRYYRSGNSGPGFLCSGNNQLPCAWGAVKVMLALSKVPEAARTPVMRAAIAAGTDFLLSHDPAVADYPMGYATKPSESWLKFGYPLGYVTDVLQNLEALTALGYGGDLRLKNALDLVLSKQDAQGRWKMEYTYNGKMWMDVEEKGRPSKWVTLRALRVLKHISCDQAR
jgi:hypothetical protein